MTALDPGDFAHDAEQAHLASQPEQHTDWLSESGVQEALAEHEAAETFDAEAFAAAVHAFAGAVAALNTAAKGLSALPWTDAAAMLDTVREARKEAATVEASLEVHTAKAMGAADVKATPMEGIGFVEWRRGRDRKEWKHDALARDVIDAHMRETDGEVPDPYTVRDWLMDAIGTPSRWKVTTLRALGLNPEDYAVSLPGKLSVQITKAE